MTERPDIDAIETEANDTLDACEYGEAVALRKVLRLCAYVRELEAKVADLETHTFPLSEARKDWRESVGRGNELAACRARISELEKALEPFAQAHYRETTIRYLPGGKYENAARVLRGES